MDINEINLILNQSEDFLRQGLLKKAIKLQRQLAVDISATYLLEKINFQQEAYDYLLKYFIDGVEDPQRKDLFEDIRLNLFTVNDLLRREIARRYQPYHQYIDYYGDLKLEFDIARIREKLQLEFIDDNKGLLEQAVMERFFVNIWLYPDLTQEDYDRFKEFFASSQDWVYKSVAVSALTLGLLQFFCPRKILLLFDLVMAGEEHIWERAFVGLLIVLSTYDHRLDFYPEIISRIKTLPEIPAFKSRFKAVVIQLLRSAVETQKIKERFEKEILPEMDRISPKIADKLDLDSLSSEDMFEDENPDWSRIMPEEEEFFNKMSEFSMLQMEGADVLISTFSNMKGFPFFNRLSNWFLPFYPDNKIVVEKLVASGMKEEDAAEFVRILSGAKYMCNSDKYSFAFQMSYLPAFQRDSTLQLFRMEAQAAKEVSEDEKMTDPLGNSRQIIIQYVQDLYRFFKLYPYRGILPDVFEDMKFHDKQFFRLMADLDVYKEVADFYFSRKFYPFALEVFNVIEKMNENADPQLLEKIGYVYQKLKNYPRALEYYRKAELFEPEKKWLIKKIAFTSMKVGNYDQAIDYYNKVLDQDPDNQKIILNIANCYLNLGDYSTALQYYYKVDYYSPDNPKVMRPIAWINFQMEDLDKAWKYYQRVLEIAPKNSDFIIAGHIRWIASGSKEALELYKRGYALYIDKIDFERDFFENKDIMNKHGISDFDMRLMFEAIME